MQVWELSTVLLVVGLLLLIVAVVVFVELKQYKVSSSFLLCGTAMTLWAVLLMTTTNLQDVDLTRSWMPTPHWASNVCLWGICTLRFYGFIHCTLHDITRLNSFLDRPHSITTRSSRYDRRRGVKQLLRVARLRVGGSHVSQQRQAFL